MPGRTTSFLRLLAATLVIGSGTGRVASLWFRELNIEAVASMLVGAVYLIIGIGLCGQSRFTLFMGIAIPAAATLYYQSWLSRGDAVQSARFAADVTVAFVCLVVLWRVRNNPSV